MHDLKKYQPLFGAWQIARKIGSGGFGEVYEITRKEYGEVYHAALKVISVPQHDDDVKVMRMEGNSEDTIKKYYEDMTKSITNEYVLMNKVKGHSNIVSYEDHMIIPHEDGIGCDILIRMELLTPLLEYIFKNKITTSVVVNLGIDICKALEICESNDIIHRDIKPENIFLSPNGDFKLGDFGIARTTIEKFGHYSQKGTSTFMAPEVYKGEAYGKTADIYSLGIVMYSLLNGNRAPFLPPASQPISYNDRENAVIRRMSGEAIPQLPNVERELNEIVLTACAYDKDRRYQNAKDMRTALEDFQHKLEESNGQTEKSFEERTQFLHHSVDSGYEYQREWEQKKSYLYDKQPDIKKKNSNRKMLFAIIGIILIVTCAVICAKVFMVNESQTMLEADQIAKVSITSWDWDWDSCRENGSVATVDVIMSVKNDSDSNISGIAFTTKNADGVYIDNQSVMYTPDTPFYSEGYVSTGSEGIMVCEATVDLYERELCYAGKNNYPKVVDCTIEEAYLFLGEDGYIVPQGTIIAKHDVDGGTYDVKITNYNDFAVDYTSSKVVLGYYNDEHRLMDTDATGSLKGDIPPQKTVVVYGAFVDPNLCGGIKKDPYWVYVIDNSYGDGEYYSDTYKENYAK